MSVIRIGKYDVKFPYETPYDIQINYMTKVIECLEDKKHGILESPTGTGKTLCLFAPVTSWLSVKKLQRNVEYNDSNSHPGENPAAAFWGLRQRVWYTARTHSQIAQTVTEVRRCDIQGLSVRVMGARDQLCVNEDVLKEKDSYIKTIKCKELVKTRSCRYYRKLEYEKFAPAVYKSGEVLDIEDLVSAGKSCGICPYFLAKQAKDSADVVLLPYNYIIDRDSRDTTGGTFNNDIVIFDEGHNVPNTCEESFEFSLSSVDLALGIRNIQELMESLAKLSELGMHDEDLDVASHANNSMALMAVLKSLETGLASMPANDIQRPMSDMYKFFGDAGIDETSSNQLLTALSAFKSDSLKLQLSGSILSTFILLEKMLHVAYGTAIKTFTPALVEQSFKFSVSADTEHANQSKKLALYCFNPSFGIKDVLLLGVQSLIITSGTLSPLRSFIHELGLQNTVSLENGHIATKEQVPFMILGTGVNNVKLDASFKNRKDPSYMYSLGMSLTNLIASVPDGVLLLFSSYSMMQGLREYWEESNGIWKRLNTIKRVFVEPRGKEDFVNCMENYRRAIDAGNGAILMGVLRGKVSEGMDFKDQYCRAVFVVGVPFPPVMDPRVKGKERYAESLIIENLETKRKEKLYTSSYMSVEAMKATNQAIGRVIRHGGDYGAIILVDYRFAWPRLFDHISRWIRGDKASEVNFMTAKKTLRDFFKNLHTGKINVNEVCCQRLSPNGEPIAAHVEYDVFDIKKTRQITPIPWIATGLDSHRKSGKNNIIYEDSNSCDDSTELLSSYRSTSKATKSETLSGSSKSSFFDRMGTASSSSQIQYKEIDLKLLNSELQKRKVEETSPTLLSSSQKKNRLTTQSHRKLLGLEKSYEPEPESQPVLKNHVIKEGVKNYFREAKSALDPKNKGDIFKTAAVAYIKGATDLQKTVTVLKRLFDSTELFHLFEQFEICVKFQDKDDWEKIIEEERQLLNSSR